MLLALIGLEAALIIVNTFEFALIRMNLNDCCLVEI